MKSEFVVQETEDEGRWCAIRRFENEIKLLTAEAPQGVEQSRLRDRQVVVQRQPPMGETVLKA